jgi:hypothetical protein
MMASSSRGKERLVLPNVGEAPNQPLDFAFPKRDFGKTKVVRRAFQAQWFTKWPWLHYDSGQDLAFCYTCVTAVASGKLKLSTGNVKDSAFISTGFSNWKDATVSFAHHTDSITHKTAVDLVITLPKTTGDIGELLSAAHAAEKESNRKCLATIAQCIQFLARQALALRGDGDESDSNLMQILHLRALDQPQLLAWLERKKDKYVSPQIQNEILGVMGTTVLREIAAAIQHAQYFALMADEVTDSSNKELVVICFRSVDEGFQCHEDVVGLYQVESIKSDCIVEVLKDTMIRLGLPIRDCRGQCYDGAANMAGVRNGVATQICKEEPRALFSHCYGHALNLAASDTVKQNKILCDTLATAFEISKLLKFSPRRDALFSKLKVEIAPGTPGFRTLCPTRWTVRAASLASIMDNYLVFQALWEDVKATATDPEIRARVIGVDATMNRFDFLFGLVLGERLLKHTDNLSRTLQAPSLTASEGQEIAELTRQTLLHIRTNDAFDLFWEKVQAMQEEFGVQQASLPRKRKVPRHIEIGTGEGYYPATPKEYYSQQYFECLDFIVSAIKDRFDQPGYKALQQLENLLVKAARGEEYAAELASVADRYGDDLVPSSLETQLQSLATAFSSRSPNEKPTLSDVKATIVALSPAQRVAISEVCTVLKLIMVIPATNAISERSGSALRRVKTYLRSTMSQARLNNLLLLHTHKQRTDALDIPSCLNLFVQGSEHRQQVFGKF